VLCGRDVLVDCQEGPVRPDRPLGGSDVSVNRLSGFQLNRAEFAGLDTPGKIFAGA